MVLTDRVVGHRVPKAGSDHRKITWKDDDRADWRMQNIPGVSD